MKYRQITPEERYMLAALRRQAGKLTIADMARITGRHRSTIYREFQRNTCRLDGAYRAEKAQERTNGRRSRSRRNAHFGPADWELVETLLRGWLSPDQISGTLRRFGLLRISHETIYKHIRRDRREGGNLYRSLRYRPRYRKRYGTTERRGRVDGKRHISERPKAVELRREIGHWEMDTVIGTGSRHCILTLVERVTGCVLIGKLEARSAAEVNRALIPLIRRHRDLFKTITADNGTEFHSYDEVERASGVEVYFATPYHSWERGTNENTNGLIRQYIPKGLDMRNFDQLDCDLIARSLNSRPRKRHGYLSPIERLDKHPRLRGLLR